MFVIVSYGNICSARFFFVHSNHFLTAMEEIRFQKELEFILCLASPAYLHCT